LKYFDSVKVSAPLFSNNVENAINQLKDKKEYFQKLAKEEENKIEPPKTEDNKEKDQKDQ